MASRGTAEKLWSVALTLATLASRRAPAKRGFNRMDRRQSRARQDRAERGISRTLKTAGAGFGGGPARGGNGSRSSHRWRLQPCKAASGVLAQQVAAPYPDDSSYF